ncbi:PAS domain-containing sensor histidine kinase [Paucibacter sp. KCTC 42545]|uniref:PAS domain-containing sensor histidine kinase n=1 Tax=Paucibacter sp. KCTC 42545 TaxID=1768242 RepID=UPI0009EA2657|nr:PAS domain-containing sensor histidine kinase [Paucibacter sp. KCTC 42545]
MGVVTGAGMDRGHAPDPRLLQIAATFSELGAWRQDCGVAGVLHACGTSYQILRAPPDSLHTLADCWALMQDADRDSVIAAQARCESQGLAYALDLRLKQRATVPLWVRVQAEPVLDEQGRVTATQGVFRDISAAKLAEASLQESEMRFRALIEGVERVSVQGYDSQRRVIFWNKASERLYGFSAEEAIGQKLEDLIIPPEMRELVIAGTQQWLQSGVVSVPAEELVLRHKNGSPVPVFSSHSMQRSGSGEALLYCVDVDLSERVQAEAVRHQLELRLREAQKLEALGTMAGGIAHDFNNVLGAILANVSLASALLAEDHPARQPLRLISRGGERARSMVQKMLAFSRHAPHSLEVIPLAEQVKDNLALLQASLPPRVSLRIVEADESLRVEADASELQQVLFNLCTNAWQALPAQGGKIEVGLRACHLPEDRPELDLPAGDYAHLFVRDDGSGISEETRARIFEPFFTTKPVEQGTGLGLSVVHGIVRSHRGAVALESQLGAGSCFSVYLPSYTGAAVQAPSPGPQAHGPAALPAQIAVRPQVLYVDDDEVMRLTVEGLLRRAGYRVLLCASVDEALASLAAYGQDIAVVVSDYNMPGRDGLGLAKAMQSSHPQLPLFLSTGYVSEHLQQQVQAMGLARLIKKEHLLDELVPSITQLLAGGNAPRSW